MRLTKAVLLAVAAALAGCRTGGGERSAAPPEAGGPFNGPAGADVVQVDVSQVEAPYGDHYLNRGLWELADEQVVDLERKRVLAENGFRLCQIGGLPPAGLQALLSSPRSCPDPRRLTTRAGNPTPLALGPVQERCAYQLHREGAVTPVALDDAQCLLEVVPALAEEGRVRLRFTPHVKHGSAAFLPRAERDSIGALRWALEARQPEEAYPWLAWEVTVSPDEYVVVGTRLDSPDTLGQRCFLPPAGKGSRLQRLLVVRCARAPTPERSARRAAPLAVQATWDSARGSAR